MWNAIPPSSEDEPMPPSRSKHSATLLGGHLYLLGGRNGNLPLKDLWRYSFADGKWVQLKPGGDSPPCLQEHTAVSHRDALYVFGGEVGFSAGNETPLWVYHVKTNSWRKIRTQKGSASPRGRRGHTALSHKGVMLLYGGYRDLRGSSNELWAFHFESETWHLLSAGRNGPPARHKHSAIVHDDGMWIYGGMTDLHERADLWRFDTVSRTWAAVKTKLNPGSLHSHAVCKLPSSMLLFGGERDGQPTNELWRFHFGTETWDRIHTQGVKPQPRSESVALTISDLLFRPTLSPRHTPPPTRRLRTGGSMDRTCNAATEEERTCNATQERSNATTNKQRWSAGSSFDTERSQTISERCKQRCWSGQSSFEGNLPSRRTSGTPSSNLSILKEISKLSQMNLSRLGSTNKCNYSVLSSTESIASDSSTGNGGGSEMVKSQSSNIITKSSNTPCTPGTFSTPSFLPRDPVSVPNFSLISSCSLTPVEVTKLVYLDNEEAPIPGPRSGNTGDTFQTIHNQFQPVRNNPRKFPKSASVRFGNPYVTPEEPSDETSDYASMETMNKSGNYGSGMEKGLNGQENSQRSSVNCQEMLNNDQERSGNGQEGCENGEEMLGNAQNSQEISKNILEISTNNGQARFSNTLERSTNSFDHSDEYTNSVDMLNNKSSTYTQEQGNLSSNFGQEVNKFSSNLTINGQEQSRFSSNFSVNGQEQSRFSSNFSINGQEQNKFSSNFSINGQEQTKFSSNFGPTKSNSKSSKEPPPMSFSNPNYMAPDLQTILSKKDYVKVLNSPPDSLLEDALGRSNSRQEMVEMKPVPPRSLALKSGSSMPPRSLALKNGCNYNRQMAVEKQRKQKSRASSAGRMERRERGEMTSFCVFLIGGKEHGQVTVFKRPLSVWRLVLSSEIY